MRALFAAPTVAGLAALIEDAPLQREDGVFAAVDRGGAMPLSFAEERMLATHDTATHGGMLNSSMILQLTGELAPERLERALQATVARHEILRTRYAMGQEGRFVPVISAAGEFHLSIRAVADDGVAQAREQAAELPDCFDGPVFAATLFVASPTQAWLVLNIHHAVTDGVSSQAIWRDIRDAYVREGASLAVPTLQYRDYAAWQRRHLDGRRLDELRGAWRARLAGLPACLNLPFDRPRPMVMTDETGHLDVTYPAALARDIQRVAASHRVTPFVLLETTLAIVLGSVGP